MRCLLLVVGPLALAWWTGCAAPEERETLAERLRRDGTLLRQLASYEGEERNAGIARVKALGKEQGSLLALYLLQEPTLDDYRLDVVLARILSDWRDPRAIGYLLGTLKQQDQGAVDIAAEGLLVFADRPEVLDALSEQLREGAVPERRTAANTLSRMGTPRAIEIFAERFKDESSKEVRAPMLLGVLESRSPLRKSFLVGALVDADLAIRELAWEALRQYPDVPVVAFEPAGPLDERSKGVAVLRLWERGVER